MTTATTEVKKKLLLEFYQLRLFCDKIFMIVKTAAILSLPECTLLAGSSTIHHTSWKSSVAALYEIGHPNATNGFLAHCSFTALCYAKKVLTSWPIAHLQLMLRN